MALVYILLRLLKINSIILVVSEEDVKLKSDFAKGSQVFLSKLLP